MRHAALFHSNGESKKKRMNRQKRRLKLRGHVGTDRAVRFFHERAAGQAGPLGHRYLE